ncbi:MULTISPECIES: glycosyltransferase family 4 protein [unclassified Rhodococcus (in: high G+C Gram-positive bacteria)]|uniref:glycosyltransferase family 4 protein n=1 Tax=unclassified Rhodococcus (in: high G+C Gram-positive bacteria) TaxID=192944 RepID=UPI001E2EBC75|nr:glycosyltransferase family 1 protein [Rhodococcus sp. M8]
MIETHAGLRHRIEGDAVHYLADTGPLVRTRSPSVVTVHGIASLHARGIRNVRQEKVWRTRVAAAIRNTDAVITVSKSSANDICEVFDVPFEKIDVIPHGVALSDPCRPVEIAADILGSRARDGYVLYLGNIEPRKNIIELVRAFSRPQVASLGLPLVIAGKPAWNAEAAMQEIQNAANVIYLGFVEDDQKDVLLRNASLFVFPSLYEGFGFPVLEALSVGTPTLTSRRGSLAEVAGPARTLEGLDADAIAFGIVAALDDEDYRESVRVDGPNWAANFSWENSALQHVDVYRRILKS